MVVNKRKKKQELASNLNTGSHPNVVHCTQSLVKIYNSYVFSIICRMAGWVGVELDLRDYNNPSNLT